MSEKRQDFLARYDWIRTGLMFEPRGHDLMSGTILYEPLREDTDCALLFIETSGCLPMCGHGAIGTVTVLIEEGLVTPKREGKLVFEAPAGVIEAEYSRDNSGNVVEVKLRNIPSFLYRTGLEVDVPDLGPIVFDVAYGGNFYAIIEPQPSYRGLDDVSALDIQRLSPVIRRLINEKYDFVHPENPTITGLRHVLWAGKAASPRGRCPQRRVLRREGDRPFALRHRHLEPHGPTRGPRRTQGRRYLRPRIRSSAACFAAGSKPRRRSATTTRSCPRSPARPGSPATTPSISTTAIPS